MRGIIKRLVNSILRLWHLRKKRKEEERAEEISELLGLESEYDFADYD